MHDPSAYAREVLESLGFVSEPIVPADGWSSSVLLTPTHAFRLASGRFRDAYLHEARVLSLLPAAIPHAHVVARGDWNGREWMVQGRVAGVPLGRAWPTLDRDERRAAIHALGSAIRQLHEYAVPNDFSNPWLDDALKPGGKPGDAYHASPSAYGLLLDAAAQRPDADRGLLDEVGAWMQESLHAFDGDRGVLVHGDLHFANVMWANGTISAILDWEGSRLAAPDQELDTLLRFVRTPAVYVNPYDATPLAPDDVCEVPAWFAEVYPELFSHPLLDIRLAMYEALWQLVGVFNFERGSGIYDPWANLRRLLDGIQHQHPVVIRPV